MACHPGEYGAATSISDPTAYAFRLRKEIPSLEMLSHSTILRRVSPWRMYAVKLTRVRTSRRRFELRATTAVAPGGSGAPCCPSGTATCTASTGPQPARACALPYRARAMVVSTTPKAPR
jgi:hypothetical protein